MDSVINKGIERLSKVLNLSGITWEYAIVDEQTPENLLKTILMAYDQSK